MEPAPLWPNGGPHNPITGLPELDPPIYVQIDERYSARLGTLEEREWLATEITVRKPVIASHDDALERQIRDAGVVMPRTPPGSQFMVSRRIFRMEDGFDGAWLEAVLYIPAWNRPEDIEYECFLSILSLWNSWWLADDLAGTQSAPIPVLARTVGLINAGTHWRGALSMAALEDELKPRK